MQVNHPMHFQSIVEVNLLFSVRNHQCLDQANPKQEEDDHIYVSIISFNYLIICIFK